MGIASSLADLGILAEAHGELDLARGLHEESLTISRRLEDSPGIACSLYNLGDVALHESDSARATYLFQECVTLANELSDTEGILLGFSGLAGVAAADGQRQRAARLLGAVENLRTQNKIVLSDDNDRADYERYIVSARAGSSEAAFAAAWAAGRMMAMEQAVVFALEGTTDREAGQEFQNAQEAQA